MLDEFADLVGGGEENGPAIPHHSRRHDDWLTGAWPHIAGVDFEAEVRFPEVARSPVSRGDTIGVSAIADRLDLTVGTLLLQILEWRCSHRGRQAYVPGAGCLQKSDEI